jgi:poly(A) polymerase
MTDSISQQSVDPAGLRVAVAAASSSQEIRVPVTALLLQPNPLPGLHELEEQGLLARWLPELAALRGVSQLPDHPIDALDHSFLTCTATPPTPLSRWTGLLHDIGKATTAVYTPQGRTRFFGHETVGAEIAQGVLIRLGFEADFVAAVDCLIRLHLRPLSYRSNWTDGAVLRLRAEAEPFWPELLAQCRADLLGYAPEPVERALANLQLLAVRVEQLAHPPPSLPGSPLDGYELQELFGRPPGPWLRNIKSILEHEVRTGRLAADDKEGAVALARSILAQSD